MRFVPFAMHGAVLFVSGFVGTLVLNALLSSFVGNPAVSQVKPDALVTTVAANKPASIEYDSSLSKDLEKDVRILCWIMTSPETLHTKAINVKNTWGQRCNVLLFISSIADPSFPAIAVDVEEGRNHLTAKTMHAFKYIFDNHINDADWFLKADDDSYVILENLRYMVADKSPKDPVYFGHHFKVIVSPQGYHSGGAGYLLSHEALNRFGRHGFHNQQLCAEDGGAEDVEMGVCLQKLGVRAMQSYDSLDRSRFHCFNPSAHIHGNYPDWYYQYDSHGAKHGISHMSEYPVTFHYVNPQEMLNVEYFTYNFKGYGVSRLSTRLQVNEYYGLNSDNRSAFLHST